MNILHPIPIVTTSTDFFVPYMSVMFQSVMENASTEKQYKFFILHRGLCCENMESLKDQIKKFSQFSIEFIDVSGDIKGYSFHLNNTDTQGGIPVETYFRLLIPELFSDYKKVIYLDGDMVCRVDISELYEIDLGHNLLASSRDMPLIAGYYKLPESKRKNMKCMDDYFIAGMLVFNIEEFSKVISAQEMLDLATSKRWEHQDQDVLNFISQGKLLMLPMDWDFVHTSGVKYMPDYLQDEYKKAEKNPKIIHFAGQYLKPWRIFVYVPYFELFWKYATRTPFIDTILERMRENGLIGLTYKERVFSDIKNKRLLGLRFICKAFLSRFFNFKNLERY
jgi:lipopolysaccharide biosynthesis glycosyltransferase